MNDDDLKTYKKLGILFIITLFGLWHGCTDISYMIQSKTTSAQVVKYREIRGRRGRVSNSKHVSFKFTDADGKKCTGYDVVDINWTPANIDGTVEIAYIPGKKTPSGTNSEARLRENSSMGGILIFFIAGSILSFSLYTFFRDMQSSAAT